LPPPAIFRNLSGKLSEKHPISIAQITKNTREKHIHRPVDVFFTKNVMWLFFINVLIPQVGFLLFPNRQIVLVSFQKGKDTAGQNTHFFGYTQRSTVDHVLIVTVDMV